MLKENRFDFILKQLKSKKILTYEDVARKLDVSEDTIRRDIDYLHKMGLLSKVRGGAIPREKDPLTFQDRSSFLKGEKKTIALKAQQFIKEGSTIFIDGGTTNCALVNALPPGIKLCVITNNVMVLPILAKFKNVHTIFLGGNCNPVTATTTGVQTIEQVNNFIADVYFMGTCAVDSDFGFSATIQTDAEVKRSMRASSRKIIALANHELLGSIETFKICNIDEVDALITDLPSNNAELDIFRISAIQIV